MELCPDCLKPVKWDRVYQGKGCPAGQANGRTVRASTKGFAVCKMQTAASAGAVPDTVDPLTQLAIAADLVQQK